MKLKPNIALATKSGERYSNATIFKCEPNKITIITDWGNLISFQSEEELLTYYFIPEWQIEHLALEEIVGIETETLREKLENRINLLEDAISQLEY